MGVELDRRLAAGSCYRTTGMSRHRYWGRRRGAMAELRYRGDRLRPRNQIHSHSEVEPGFVRDTLVGNPRPDHAELAPPQPDRPEGAKPPPDRCVE
jgi:hypothetical protein